MIRLGCGRPVQGMTVAVLILLVLFLASRKFHPSFRIDNTDHSMSLKSSKWDYKTDDGKVLDVNKTSVIQHAEVNVPLAGDPSCLKLPDTSNILVIMKTGATESYYKLPTQILTTLRCLDNFLIFSDMNQTIAGVEIYDSLETVLPEAMEGNSDFDLYRRQYACDIDQENCSKEAGSPLSSAGWELDKYKNIHIAQKAYDMHPDYDWYITVDADTYILWPNIVQWLSTLDPSGKYYLGSVTMIGGFPFGHGGSGYILSRAAMQAFVGDNIDVASKYDIQTKHACCGDYMFAKALRDTTGIGVRNAWPTINGEKPFTLPFGPSHWCQPVVTMHHMNSEEISNFWEFEKRFYESREPTSNPTLLLKDIYEYFLEPRLQARRDDWDNLSEDVYYLDPDAKNYEEWQLNRAKHQELSDTEQNAHKSFDHCAKMCDEVGECFQFRFQDGICSYQKGFLLGHPKKKESEEDQRWISGWAILKIKTWAQKYKYCENPVWPSID